MSAISDSSQEASNAAISTCLTPISSPNIFIKSELPDLQRTALFNNSPDILKPSTSSTEQSQKRRSSSRSIKRKKFDDELVESSLIKSSRARPQNTSTFPILPSTPIATPSISALPSALLPSSVGAIDASSFLSLEKRKPRPTKRIKKPKANQAHLSKDVSRWKPVDDLSLILSVQQTNDLETVHRGVKFSSKFTLRDVQERWYALLYNVSISKAALFAVKQLNPEIIAQVQSKVLFSTDEEKLIASVPSDTKSQEVFQELLDSNASAFLPSRTARVLHSHWTLMKQYNLLSDQTVQQQVPVESLMTFSDTEELLDDADLQDPKDSALDDETAIVNRRHLQEIKQLENEVPKWQVLVECVTGVSLPEFDNKTLAVLQGRIVRYLIQSREVSFGRQAKDNGVDIDLWLEGPAWKISRRQGSIKMEASGEFLLSNEGKKPVFIDGKPVVAAGRCKLANNSVVEIAGLRFIFIINQEAVSNLRSKTIG